MSIVINEFVIPLGNVLANRLDHGLEIFVGRNHPTFDQLDLGSQRLLQLVHQLTVSWQVVHGVRCVRNDFVPGRTRYRGLKKRIEMMSEVGTAKQHVLGQHLGSSRRP